MRFGFRSLKWRIAAWTALILLSMQIGALLLFAQIGRTSALAEVGIQLDTGNRVFARLIDQRSAQLAQAARVLAADYGFRDALLSRDRATIESALDNHGSRIGAALMLLIGLDGRVIGAHPPRPDAIELGTVRSLIDEAGKEGSANGFQFLDGALYQVVVVPVRAPVAVAWVVIGFPADEVFVQDLKRLTGLEVSLKFESAAQAQAMIASTLAPTLQPALLHTPSLESMELDSVEYAGRVHVIEADDTGRVTAVLQLSLARALQPWNKLYRDWTGLSIAATLLMLLASVWVGRTIASPVTRLAQFARRVEGGDYGAPPRSESGDEIAQLADAFGVMTDAIASREARISELAYCDALTGLPNRVRFMAWLEQSLQAVQRSGQPLALLSFDIDRFKLINDTLGHGFGDRVLHEVGQRLLALELSGDAGCGCGGRDDEDERAPMRSATARLGGDEFAVLLPAADLAAALTVAERVANALEQPMNVQGQLVDLRASIGIALYPQHATDAAELIRCADVAMYKAKRGIDGVEVYDPAHHERNAARLSLLTELRQAVEGHELVLFYQPKYAFQASDELHVEALVRWIHPQRGFISPMDFIPFAEQTGYIRTITHWVMNESIRQCAQWQRSGRKVHIGLNLSARDLLQPELPAQFCALLERHACRADWITLEITESAVLDDPAKALANLEHLRATGCRLSIDDYGTGYSSLSYVRQMPVQELKIDRSFVMNLITQPDDEIIVRSTIELAHNMGLTVTAEGVETEAVLQRLAELGCDLAQGYFICRPLGVAELETWLQTSPWARAGHHQRALADETQPD